LCSRGELPPFYISSEIELTADERDVASAWNSPQVRVRDGKGNVLVALDVHHQPADDIDAAQFFDFAVASAFDGALTMSPADTIWFLTAKFYNEVALQGRSRYVTSPM